MPIHINEGLQSILTDDERESGAIATDINLTKYFVCCCNLAHDSKSCFGQNKEHKEEETNDGKV